MEDDGHGNLQGRSPAVLAVSISFICCTSIFVFLRMISRGVIVKRISIDDWLMVIAWLLTFGMTFAVCYGTSYGLGRHEADIPDSWQPTLHKANYAFSVLYNPALMAEKTSILFFYLTLSQTRQIFRWATIATLVVVNAGGLALTLLSVFQCHPVSAVFDQVIPNNAYCTDIVTIYLSSAPLNIITDLAILFLPLPILTGIRLPRRQKVILIITFSFGAFATAVDVVRISALQSAAQTRLDEIQNHSQRTGSGGTDQSATLDISWYAAFSFMWSVVEVNVGIMCGCVPALKPLVSRFLPNILRDSKDDATLHANSVCHGRPTLEMAEEHRVPSVSDSIEHQHPSRVHSLQQDTPLGMVDFLTTPDTLADLDRTQTAMTNTSRNTRVSPPVFFDFVNTQKKKGLVHLTNRESIFPIAMVTILFFIWGFEYGLLDVLNREFQQVAHMTTGQTTAIHSAYYAGYILGPWLIGHWVLQHWGFKACFSVGLSIYACGTLIFWPAAVLTSFPAYLIVNLIVGSGLSILEVAANPFISLCGPPQYAEARLNLSQGVQAIGTVIAPLIAQVAIVQRTSNVQSLISTQYAYLGIALFTVLLAVVYHYIPLPEVTDAELEDASERFDNVNGARVGGVSITVITLALCAIGQFCYVGAQEVNGTGFGEFLLSVRPDLDPTNYTAVAHTAFVLSRFLGAALALWIAPRILLVGFFLGAIVFQALAISLSGDTALAMLIIVFFMEGPLFSLLFAQALRGQGRRTKLASVLVASMTSGGAAFAPASNIIATSFVGAQRSLVVAVAVFSAGAVAVIGLNILPQARLVLDPVRTTLPLDSERSASPDGRHRKSSPWFDHPKHVEQSSPDVEFRERGKS
ncbi:hypothetical protein AMS68_003014 [Peltaster fructicola]|uniref:Rhodopsin domain-containing protein n=1 Tax=Peltaster fructicola TaxID=286661 RepID=A0A6H0XRW3_9PEZI|nr:hypothetical protein AMS68_003014 [Peltaster fructicola]